MIDLVAIAVVFGVELVLVLRWAYLLFSLEPIFIKLYKGVDSVQKIPPLFELLDFSRIRYEIHLPAVSRLILSRRGCWRVCLVPSSLKRGTLRRIKEPGLTGLQLFSEKEVKTVGWLVH